MADNTVLPGTGETYAAKELGGGVKEQIVQIKMADSPSVGAFSRLRVSEPATIFDSKQIIGEKHVLFWDEEIGAGMSASAPTADKPYTDALSTLNTAGVYIRQTFQRFNYQPGKSHMILITGGLSLSGGGAGVVRNMGYFDEKNGIFFSDIDGVVNVVRRSHDSGAPVDTAVPQTAWNLDKMDGSGNLNNPSGFLADWTKSQILVMDFQWLGVGRIRWGIEINGAVCYVHEFASVNVEAIPWASTPNLPIRQEMITQAVSPASAMRSICSAIISEGGRNPSGMTNSASTSEAINANTTGIFYALLGGRLKSSCLGTTIKPLGVTAIALTPDSFEWQIRFNATVAGTFAYADKLNSCMQVAFGDTVTSPSTNTVTGGTIIASGFGAGAASLASSINSVLTLGSSIAGVRDTFVLCVRPLSANLDIEGSANWNELG